MRDLLDKADLARYAGQFVWLEVNFDAPENREFFSRYGANATPTFYVIDAENEQVTATQTGAMSLAELTQFLDRGAASVAGRSQSPADAALKRGDTLLASQPAEAASAYREALSLAPAAWTQRELAEASFVNALQDSHEWQQCAEAAANEATEMTRGTMFARTVVAGMWCVVSTDPVPWWQAAAAKLEPLAVEALSLPTTVRDHRDELYRTLMLLAVARKDNASAAKWGDKWLAELDAIKPRSDEERWAVDIARVENVQVFGDPNRILPALRASEHAMQDNYIASLRVAQMEIAAKHYDPAIAACNRGLTRSPGANGRAWLLRIKAQALMQKGKTAEARHALQQALQAAQAIPNEKGRDMNVRMISESLKKPEKSK